MIATCYLGLIPTSKDGKITGFRIEKATKTLPRNAGHYVKLLIEVPVSAFGQEVKVTIPETAIGMIEVVVEEETTIEIILEEDE